MGVVERVFAAGGAGAEAVEFEQFDGEGMGAAEWGGGAGGEFVAADLLALEEDAFEFGFGQRRFAVAVVGSGRDGAGDLDVVGPDGDAFVLLAEAFADEDASARGAVHADPLAFEPFGGDAGGGAAAEGVEDEVAFFGGGGDDSFE